MGNKIIAVLLALLTLAYGGAGSVIGATPAEPITAQKRDYVFDRDRLLFGAWCFVRDDRFPTLVRDFKQAGLQFFVCSGEQHFTDEDLAWMDENDVGFFNADTEYGRSLTNRCAWGVLCRDEPCADEFEYLGARVAQGYEEAPDRLPFINLFPMYASSKQLGEKAELPLGYSAEYLDTLNIESIRYRMHLSDYIGAVDSDVVSFDVYPLFVSRKTGKLGTYGLWLRNLDIVAESCRKTGRDLWVVTQAAGNLLEEGSMRYCDTVEDQRWQNYVTLAFGAKAIIYGCYYTGWWDGPSHMIDDDGSRTDTYYAVQQATQELAAFSDVYTNYENHGAVLYHRMNSDTAGASLGLLRVPLQHRPLLQTDDPVLCGCFTAKQGGGRAYVLANMFEPQTGKDAEVTLCFPLSNKVTLYRKGVKTETTEKRLTLTLESREGVFITVE